MRAKQDDGLDFRMFSILFYWWPFLVLLFFLSKMDSTAVPAVGNKKQTQIERADVVVISDFQFIFFAPLQNIIHNICS